MKGLYTILLPIFSLVFVHCTPKHQTCPVAQKDRFLHIAHCYSSQPDRVLQQVEKLDFDCQDLLLLGGDLLLNSSKEKKHLDYLDHKFDLSNPNTLWSVGNHDAQNETQISHFTKRQTYYHYRWKDISFVVLNTELNGGDILGEQLQLLQNVTDTLAHAKYLMILHHKLIWLHGEYSLEVLSKYFSNGPIGECAFCIKKNNFYEKIYPKLVQVERKGINVICLGGDIGKFTNEFEYKTKEGIDFIASGMADRNDNKVLQFEYDPLTSVLNWKYLDI